MAMTYSAFKTYLADMLWRPNDTDLANNTDNLIRMANAELNRKLTIQRREVTAQISPTQEDYVVPFALHQIVSLVNNSPSGSSGAGRMSVVPESVIYEQRAQTESTSTLNIYALQKTATAATIRFVGPMSVSTPGDFTITYREAVPDYAVTDASWVEDEYLDLYVYCVFKHMAVFLREDERITQYNALFTDALASAIDEDNHSVRFGGSPLQMHPHRTIPITRRN